jgi:hypothetical protein
VLRQFFEDPVNSCLILPYKCRKMRGRITGYTLREEPGSYRTFQLLGLGEGNIGFVGPSEVLESSTFVAPCHDIVGIEPDASSKHLMASSSSLAHFIMHPTIIN